MKKFYAKSLVVAAFVMISSLSFAQNVGINTTGTNPSSNAILDLNSGNKYNLGLIIPHVELSSTLTQFSPPIIGAATIKDTGMMVYNVSALYQPIGYYYWSGSTWVSVSGAASSGWTTTGNGGTNPAINYAGTSGPQDFVMRTSAVERMRITSAGAAGIGTPTPKSAVDVNGNMSIGTYAGVNAAPANGVIISGQVGVGTNSPNASAAMDVTSVTGGLLPPRMTATQMNAIAAPATGLVVLNTTTNCLEYYSGISWQTVVCPCSGPPATPGSITGATSICASSAGNVYSIATVANATSYNWTVPAGATITAGTGTTSITVTFGSTSGNITVTATNSCGTSGAATLAITILTAPSAPAVPSGTTTPVVSTSYTYTIATVAGATSYTWSTSNTNLASVTTGQGTTSVTITNTASAGTYTICVYASNACGNSASTCLTVTSSTCNVTHGTQTFNPTNATGPNGNIQNWTVPCGITSVTITAYGAAGGTGLYGAGGKGAEVVGTFVVTFGEVIDVIVGQAGVGGSGPYYCGSGGGGSYVWNTSSTTLPLVVAGGGGGSAYNSTSGGGSATTTPVAATGSGCGAGGAGGNGGAGGGGTNNGNISTGGGGAGWLSNGANGTVSPFAGGGSDPANGGTGGAAGSPGTTGGFGGGGGCVGNDGAGGGGGGYNGGGGGNMWNGSAWGGGGGGGSYNGGTAQTNVAATRSGAGIVTIVY
jgi:hypothetical protein